MALQFDPSSDAQFQFAEQHHWIPQFGVSYAVGVDGIALVLIALSAVLDPGVHPRRLARRARGRPPRSRTTSR